MKVLKNTRKKQVFVQQKNDSINAYITVPFAGAHRATKLTIRSGETRLDLNGRQVKTLRAVLEKSRVLTEGKTTRRSTASR